MTVEELKKSSPVLVNRDVWKRIKNENENLSSEENLNKVNFTVIHLYYKSINEVEYSLLNTAAKDCCYWLTDELRELDGYLLFVGDLDNIDDYWKKYIEYLKKNNGIDMENAKTARAIMESYNLMGFCIADETLETAKFIFDSGDDVFETYPFSYLKREASEKDMYKNIVNLMTKVSR